MSTKTSFKRIALVAASALALGGFSVISAPQASAANAPTASYTTMYDTTNGYQVVGGQATLTIGVDSATTSTVTTSGVGSIVSYAATSPTNAAGTETLTAVTGGFQYNPNAARRALITAGNNDTLTVVLTSAVAGAQIITIQPLNTNGTPGTAVTKTVTWTASGTTAASSWSAYLVDTATGITSSAGLVDSTVPLFYDRSLSSGSSVRKAQVIAKLKDGNGLAVSGALVSVTISGPGLIAASNAANGIYNTSAVTPAARVVSVTTGASGYVSVLIGSDGSTGTATVTLTSGTATVTRSVTFTGAASTYTTATGVSYLAVGANGTDGSSTSYALAIVAKDSSGNLASSGTVYAVSSDKTKVTVVASQAVTTSGAYKGYAFFALQGIAAGKSTITFTNTDPTGTTAATVTTTAEVEVTSSTANALTLAFDKAEYAPGEKGSLLVTLTNAAGRPVADGAYTIFASTGGLATNLQTQANASGAGTEAFNGGETTVTTSGGVATLDFYAPVTPGAFTASATTISASTVSSKLSQAVRGATLTAVANIAGSTDAAAALALDAANAATDAANNAYDEAQNATQAASDALAAVTALAAQVEDLIAMVKKLTKAVAKLKK